MGKRSTRRHRGIGVSLGKFAAGLASRLCLALEKRAGDSRSLCDERIRTLQHGRQRARMVRRLVRRELLPLLSQSKPARTNRWHAKGFPGRFLETSHQGEPKRGALEHSAAVPIRRLRLSNRTFFGSLKGIWLERANQIPMSLAARPKFKDLPVCCLRTPVRLYYRDWAGRSERIVSSSSCPCLRQLSAVRFHPRGGARSPQRTKDNGFEIGRAHV